VWVGGAPAGNGSDMEVLDPVHGRQRKGKSFPLFGCDKLIDIDGMDGLIACSIATTVAKRLPASGYTGQKDVSHIDHLSSNTDTDRYRHVNKWSEHSPAQELGADAAATPHYCGEACLPAFAWSRGPSAFPASVPRALASSYFTAFWNISWNSCSISRPRLEA
jgi:hypothetical protein